MRWRGDGIADTVRLGECLARCLPSPTLTVYLSGDLGAGKTLLVRSILKSRGETGAVPSPSYALCYSYQINGARYRHLDLYRLQTGEVGDDLLEAFDEAGYCFVEWPERARDLPVPDVWLKWLTVEDETREIELAALSPRGEAVCQKLAAETECAAS